MEISQGTVAFISGGASGLGAATARRIVAAGGSVVLLDLADSVGSELVADLGPQARFVPGDVRVEEDVRGAVEAAGQMGQLRIGVCCAGVATPGRILGKRGVLPLADFRHVVEVNLIGTMNVLRLAAEEMAGLEPAGGDLGSTGGAGGDRGVLVLTASVAAFEGQVGQAAYSASKGGVASLTLTAARDLAQYGIRVATIAPGVFETPMMAGLGEEVRSGLEELVPHPHRLGRPAEYAALAEHIITNPMLNGEVIRLDGARRMPAR